MIIESDFKKIQKTKFPAAGSDGTPVHYVSDFKFVSYAPQGIGCFFESKFLSKLEKTSKKGFKYFRKVFNVTDQQYADEILT